MKGSFGHLTLPALARESGPLHGPSPLASFGMKGSFGHLTLPALARESGPLHGPFPLASFGNHHPTFAYTLYRWKISFPIGAKISRHLCHMVAQFPHIELLSDMGRHHHYSGNAEIPANGSWTGTDFLNWTRITPDRIISAPSICRLFSTSWNRMALRNNTITGGRLP